MLLRLLIDIATTVLIISTSVYGAYNKYTGVITGSVSAPTDKNRWEIYPTNPFSNSIELVFSQLNIASSELKVYDGLDTVNGKLLWNCAGCGLLPPPPFVSSVGRIVITLNGAVSNSFSPSSFTLKYIGLTTNQTAKYNYPLITNLNIGYGKLNPILVDKTLQANAVQIWNITTPLLRPIRFSFSKLALGSTCSVSVEIFDGAISSGNLVYSGCKDSNMPSHWVVAKSGISAVRLTNKLSSSIAIDFTLTFYSDSNLFKCGSFLPINVMNDLSMIITDGSASNFEVRQGADCQWLLQPYRSDATVTLILNWVSLLSEGKVRVYDNNTKSGAILWNGNGATFTVPPPIISSGNSLFVTYETGSQSTVGYLGFLGEFMSNYLGTVGIGSGKTTLAMSSVIDLMPPGSADGTSFTPNLTYYWYIKPSKSNGVITFSFSLLNLSDPGNYLVLYDGPNTSVPVIANFTGTQTPHIWYKSSSSLATLVFRSGNVHNQGGFKLSYYIDGPNYHCGFTRNPATLTAASMTFTDGSMASETIYPNQYCEWVIQPQNSTGIYLFFNTFNVIGGQLDIYIGSISSNNFFVSIQDTGSVPAPMRFSTSKISLVFSTTSSTSGTGFSATYFGISPSYNGPGDGVVKIRSSSMISLTVANAISLKSGSTVIWQVKPNALSNKIYFSIASFAAKQGKLEIFDGSSMNANKLLLSIDNTTTLNKTWIQTSTKTAMLRYTSTGYSTQGKTFDLSYYSDGPNSHCGFTTNPGLHNSNSMIFTDGSSSTEKMYPNQNCEWLIKPVGIYGALFLEFLENDLRGAMLTVYDGSSTQGSVLWMCSDCKLIPRTLISTSGSFYITFWTSTSTTMGYGFRAVYWTSTSPLSSWRSAAKGYLLESPKNFVFDKSISNTSAAWVLGVSTNTASLQFDPYYTSVKSTFNFDSTATDGRPTTSTFQSLVDTPNTCGNLMGGQTAVLTYEDFNYRTTQYTSSYLKSFMENKTVYSLGGTLSSASSSNLVESASVCKYQINNNYITSFTIYLNNFVKGQGRLQIYTGIYGNDNLVFDSAINTWSSGSSSTSKFLAPCGRATVLLYTNETYLDYSFDLSYRANPDDMGEDCAAYIKSLLPVVKKKDPWLLVYIIGGAFVTIVIISVLAYYNRKKLARMLEFQSKRVYNAVTPMHPRYSPKWDAWRNKYLPKGQCCVCNEGCQVLILPCKHPICLEDLKGYIDAALGDISMFPVKCPMHYDGCTGTIDSSISKRVLSLPLYERFIEFSDRATYGDGMRCIFCNNFVNFPPDGHTRAQVECPYCIQKFCIRCKKPWHYNGRCPLDHVDDSLESWKASSGAQKCPACHKLIEKEDPTTCHHMVHKITDGIPCTRDRTDFCYLCGEEVTPDYPHEEVNNLGVNHFPDGVFQKCRIITFREKEEERERLKRMRRMKNKNNTRLQVKRAAVIPMEGQEFDEEAASPAMYSPLDRFDEQWDQVTPSPVQNALLDAALSPEPAPLPQQPTTPLQVIEPASPVAAAPQGNVTTPTTPTPSSRGRRPPPAQVAGRPPATSANRSGRR